MVGVHINEHTLPHHLSDSSEALCVGGGLKKIRSIGKQLVSGQSFISPLLVGSLLGPVGLTMRSASLLLRVAQDNINPTA